MTNQLGQCLFMRQSRSVRHAQWHAATLSRNKVARQNRTIKSQVWHRSEGYDRLNIYFYAYATK